MSRHIRAHFQLSGSANTTFLLAVILMVICFTGCAKTSEDTVNQTTSENESGLPKLVDLGATTCIPCKKMAPILDELEVEYDGVLDVSFIDVWQPVNKVIAESYGVEEIPVQIFLDPKGKELWRHVGFITKADILAKWEELGYDLKQKNKVSRNQ